MSNECKNFTIVNLNWSSRRNEYTFKQLFIKSHYLNNKNKFILNYKQIKLRRKSHALKRKETNCEKIYTVNSKGQLNNQ